MIFDVNDELLAILDASAQCSPDDKHSQTLMFNFVNQSAGMVENAYFLDRQRSAWVLQLSPAPEFLEVQTDYLIAFDEKGVSSPRTVRPSPNWYLPHRWPDRS